MAQKTRDEIQALSGNGEPYFGAGKDEAWDSHGKCVFLIWGPDNICTTEQCTDCAIFQNAREEIARASEIGEYRNGIYAPSLQR